VPGQLRNVSITSSASWAVEHLHEDRYLDPFTKAVQVDLTKKEAIIEHIARTTLWRIVLDDTLWPYPQCPRRSYWFKVAKARELTAKTIARSRGTPQF
jgi:hypothetical protein